MKLLIVSATSLEIRPLLKSFEFKEQAGPKRKRYIYKNHDIDVLVTGPGMTATAYWMGKALATSSFDAIMNPGLAGSFDENIELTEVVNVNSDWFSEMGAEDGESFLSLIDMDLLEDEDYPLNQGEITNEYPLESASVNSLRKAKGITVNKVHGNEESIERARSLFNPDVESMEGAAFLYAAQVEKVKCLQLRAISNYMERRNKDNWRINDAVESLCQETLSIINEL